MDFTPAVMAEGDGPRMMLAIRGEIPRRGIQVVDHVIVTDLLTAAGAQPTQDRVRALTWGAQAGDAKLLRSLSIN